MPVATKLTFDIATGSIINADISPSGNTTKQVGNECPDNKSKFNRYHPSRFRIGKFDPGDSRHRRLGNTNATGVDYADLPDIDQFQAIGRTTAGTGDAHCCNRSQLL